MSDTQKLELNGKQGHGPIGAAVVGHGKKGRLAGLATGENIKEKQVGEGVLVYAPININV